MSRYPIALLLSLAVCFACQTLALRLAGGRTLKSESNYFSSIARIQTESTGSPQVLLLGSSLSGRLPDRPGVGNLGCDGGSAVVGLRAIDEGYLPAAPVILVEANTLSYELEKRGSQIGAAIRSDWFDLGRRIPNFGATARPAAFAYSWLMERRRPAAGDDTGTPGLSTSQPAPLSGRAPALDHAGQALVDDISSLIRRLEAKGSRIELVMLPANGTEEPRDLALARALALRTGNPWWDLNAGLAPGSLHYTDGRHLDPASARKVMDALMSAVGGSAVRQPLR